MSNTVQFKNKPTNILIDDLITNIDKYSFAQLQLIRTELCGRGFDTKKLPEKIQRIFDIFEDTSALEKHSECINELLKTRDRDGRYEYRAFSLLDANNGIMESKQIIEQLNLLALDGWKLAASYTNEIGKNTFSGGIAGFNFGSNSTIDQHIFILERFVKTTN